MMEFNYNPMDEIMNAFSLEFTVDPYGDGHINDTFVADAKPRYILQRINTSVFKNPQKLMENIYAVTRHLRGIIKENGGNPERETLNVVKTKDGKLFFESKEGKCYRMYKFIDDTITLNLPENPEQFESSAKAFGRFQNMLSNFDASSLYETIPDFHNTPKRTENLIKAYEEDVAKRKDEVKEIYDAYLEFASDCATITKDLESGKIPTRVTHNDTKLNNVLFDAQTKEGLCVIDLDTVMPGSLLFDYGDSLRFGASSAAEDEADLDKVFFRLEYFEGYTKGFLSELGDKITEREIELLPLSALTMTYECGIRFLTDYLNGDTYFKIHYADQNLVRAKNHLKLCQDIFAKLGEMKKIVDKYI